MRRHVIPDVVQGQQLATMPKTATVAEAARCMNEREVSSVLVVEEGRLLGIFTVRDMARRVVGQELGLDTPLADVMTCNPETVDALEIPLRALRAMHDGGYRHLPVTENDEIVGILSRRDFFSEDESLLEQETALWEHL
ncbi:MAG: CBS domain-containing protein [Gammaproteobacteria bacterium]|jgi:CBS domain-containing protein